MRLRDVAGTATFRLAALFSAAFTALVLVLFALIYWQTAAEETSRIDRFLTGKAELLAAQPAEQALVLVQDRTVGDLHRFSFAGLFAPDGSKIAGNLAHVPPGLPADGKAHELRDVAADGAPPEPGPIRLVARTRSDGGVIVLGRNVDELGNLRQALARALEAGLLPAVVLSLAAGTLLSLRVLSRVTAMRQSLERIMHGHIRERLPTGDGRDEFGRLARSVNLTLDEIERLMDEVRGVGDDIAHDLRTPLARMRARLERRHGGSAADADAAIDGAIADIDQTFVLIDAILRIGEIETSRRRAAFGEVSLQAVAREVQDLYEPSADAKQIALSLATDEPPPVDGDRDLLMEAVGNLVDNAIKFTPPGGQVRMSVTGSPAGPVVEVADTGPGIPEDHRSKVFARFHRVDKSRRVGGNGLGLSLVLAIARLHGFAIEAGDDRGAGCVMRLSCFATSAAPPGPAPARRRNVFRPIARLSPAGAR